MVFKFTFKLFYQIVDLTIFFAMVYHTRIYLEWFNNFITKAILYFIRKIKQIPWFLYTYSLITLKDSETFLKHNCNKIVFFKFKNIIVTQCPVFSGQHPTLLLLLFNITPCTFLTFSLINNALFIYRIPGISAFSLQGFLLKIYRKTKLFCS